MYLQVIKKERSYYYVKFQEPDRSNQDLSHRLNGIYLIQIIFFWPYNIKIYMTIHGNHWNTPKTVIDR